MRKIKLNNFYANFDIKNEIKEINKLKQANIFSIIGPKASGKKHLAKYMLNKWKKNAYLIKEKTLTQFKLEQIINNSEEKTLIIDHPDYFKITSQKQLLTLIEKNIASEKIQWIAVISQENNLITSLKERLEIFKIYMPVLSKRPNDCTKFIQHHSKIKQELKITDYRNFKTLKKAIQNKLTLNKHFLNMDYKTAIKTFEKLYIQKLIDKYKTIKKISELIKLDRTTIYRKLNN